MINGNDNNNQTTESPAVITANTNQSNKKQLKNKGPYILGATLGEGAFAKVKVATQTQTKEKVAIKILNKSRLLEDKNDIFRIKKEIKIIKKLRHKNIIQLYEVLESKKSLYIVMEYCEGGELFDYIVKKRKISETEACHLFQQIINGVEYLHEQNIIHRDLKPENILLDSNLNIKISDFGLSTFFDFNNLLQTPCGTPSYAPPEMLKGYEYNGTCSDIWSCGIILFAMLCGALPFSESKEDVICRKIMTHDYVIPGYVSREAQDLLNHIMKINPKERYDIKMIKKHQWFNMITPKFKPGLMIEIEKLPIDEVILNMVEQYGFDKEKCRYNLDHNVFDSITCVYYLCLRKHIAMGGKSISDVDSDLFEEYITNQRYMKEKEFNNESSSDSDIVDNNNEEYDVNDNEGNEYEGVVKKKSANNLRCIQPVLLLHNNDNNASKLREQAYSVNESNRGMIPHLSNVKSMSNNNVNQNEQSIKFTSSTIIEPNEYSSSIINSTNSNTHNINSYNAIPLSNNTKYQSTNTTKSKSQNGKIRKIRAEHKLSNKNHSNNFNHNGKPNSNLGKIANQNCNSNNNSNTTNLTNLTSITNTSSNNISHYPIYSLNKSKPKQIHQFQPHHQQTSIQQSRSQAKQTIPSTQTKKSSSKVTPLQSNAKDQTVLNMEINTMLKKKIKEFSSSVGITSQKDCASITTPNKIPQVNPINSNRQSFASTNNNNNNKNPNQAIAAVQREQYKKNRNDAKEGNSRFQHKSNPCPNELLSLIDKDDDDVFLLNSNENINVIDIISKRLMEKSSFFGSFQFPPCFDYEHQKVFAYTKEETNTLTYTMDNSKNKSNVSFTTSNTINSNNTLTHNGGNTQSSSNEIDNSPFLNVISLFNKSYKNKLIKDYKNEVIANANINNDMMNSNSLYPSTKTTIKKNILSKRNKEKIQPMNAKDNTLNSINVNMACNKINQKYNLIIPSAKKYKNDTSSYNAIADCHVKRNKVIEEESYSSIFHPKSNNTRHYNKFLDISTNYDPALDSRGESSVERSISIKSDLRNMSISPDRKKAFSISNKQLLTMNTLNSSFSGIKSTTSLKPINNNIGVISEDDEFKLNEKNLRNLQKRKNHYHNIEKKVTINLSLNINDNHINKKKGQRDT